MTWVKKNRYILFISTLFVISMILNEGEITYISIGIMSLLTLCAGFHIFKKALIDLRYKIIGIDLLVTIAVMAAFVIGDFFEAAAVTYLFTLGHILEKKSLEKTRSSLKALMDLKPMQGRRIQGDSFEMVNVESLHIGDLLLVKLGEKIPTDGKIIEGHVMIDEQMMTGESISVEKNVGDVVLASTLITSGYIKMKVTKTGEDTTLAQMIHMVEEAQDNKAKTQKFMESFSTYYTPFIVLLSIFIYLISFDIRTAVTMLVIACPGALVIATPVSFVAGIGNAAKQGILFKGGDSIERLSKGNIVFFDKTGTLTEGKPELIIVESYVLDEDELIRIAAIGESYSEHPLASAIINKAKIMNLNIDEKPDQTELMIGKGISFRYNEVKYYIGNYKMLPFDLNHKNEKRIKELEQDGYTTLIMSDDNKILGLFGIADTLRPKTKSMIAELKKLSIKDTIMLTGDQAYVAGRIANEIGISTYHYGLLPEDKASIIKNYQKNNHTIFVGDGINDALALSYADASVAVGGLGKDLAMETADVVLLSEDIGKLTDAIKISRKVKTNMIQNIIFALLVVAFLMVGVIFNEVTMSVGMLVHELSVLLVIINAIRLLGYKPHKGSI